MKENLNINKEGLVDNVPTTSRYVWEIHSRIPHKENPLATTPCQMTVVASHVNQVWDYIAADRADERTEIVAIIRRDPVVCVL